MSDGVHPDPVDPAGGLSASIRGAVPSKDTTSGRGSLRVKQGAHEAPLNVEDPHLDRTH